jgi:YbbR domain-containing protein
VVANADIQYLPRFFNSGEMEIIPPVVKVTGPRALVQKTDTIYTRYRRFRKVKSDLDKELTLDIPDGFSADPKKVSIQLPVDEFTQKSFYSPITIRSLPAGIIVRLFPRDAEISFSVGLKQYSEVTPENFTVYVEWEDIENGLTVLPLRTGDIPEGLRSLNINPKHVEYLIERN